MFIEVNIEPEEILFYYYQNWQAGQQNFIHRDICGICNYGTGMHQNVVRGQNGVWIGPFTTLELAVQYVQGLGEAINIHGCCNQ